MAGQVHPGEHHDNDHDGTDHHLADGETIAGRIGGDDRAGARTGGDTVLR